MSKGGSQLNDWQIFFSENGTKQPWLCIICHPNLIYKNRASPDALPNFLLILLTLPQLQVPVLPTVFYPRFQVPVSSDRMHLLLSGMQ